MEVPSPSFFIRRHGRGFKIRIGVIEIRQLLDHRFIVRILELSVQARDLPHIFWLAHVWKVRLLVVEIQSLCFDRLRSENRVKLVSRSVCLDLSLSF